MTNNKESMVSQGTPMLIRICVNVDINHLVFNIDDHNNYGGHSDIHAEDYMTPST